MIYLYVHERERSASEGEMLELGLSKRGWDGGERGGRVKERGESEIGGEVGGGGWGGGITTSVYFEVKSESAFVRSRARHTDRPAWSRRDRPRYDPPKPEDSTHSLSNTDTQ